MLKVKGHEGLKKDPHTGAIVNTDRRSFLAAKAAKKKIMESNQQNDVLERRIESLENIVNQLLEDKQRNG